MTSRVQPRLCRICKSPSHTACTGCNTCGHSRNQCKVYKRANKNTNNYTVSLETFECPICYEEIGQDKCTTLCGHAFCSKCFITAFTLNATCPLCRTVHDSAQSQIDKQNLVLHSYQNLQNHYARLHTDFVNAMAFIQSREIQTNAGGNLGETQNETLQANPRTPVNQRIQGNHLQGMSWETIVHRIPPSP